MTPMQHSIEDIAYLAGIVDGEGSVTLLGEFGRSLTLMLVVGQANYALISWLRDTFGGNISEEKLRGLSRKQFWRWYIRGDCAAAILSQIAPYLKVKAELARVGCEGWANRNPTAGRRALDPEVRALRESYYVRMRELNGSGPITPRIKDVPSRWEPVTLNCIVCGTPFQRTKSRIKKSGNGICSPACLDKWRVLHARNLSKIRWGHRPE